MAKINCFHCNAEIDLIDTKKERINAHIATKFSKFTIALKNLKILWCQTEDNVNTFENTVNILKAKKQTNLKML